MQTINNVAFSLFIFTIHWAKVSCDSSVPVLNTTKFYRVSVLLAEPFLMPIKEGGQGDETKYEGYIHDLLNELSEHIGVHFKYTVAKDGVVGAKQKDGTWNGIVGELIRKEADLGAGPITISAVRGRVIDFSKPFMNSGTTVVIDDPPDSETDVLSSGQKVILVLCPFTVYAWMLIIMATVLVMLFALLLRRFLPNPEEKQRSKSCMASILNAITSLRVGGQWSTCAFRFTCCCFVLLTLILYTAGAVSLLLHLTRARHHSPPVSNTRTMENMDLDDMLKSDYTIVVVKDGSTSSFLKHSKMPLYHEVYQKLHYVNSISEGFELLHKKSSTAFITDSALANYFMMRKPYCHMEKTKLLSSNGYGLAFPLNSELYDSINLSILSMQESGLLQMLQKKWWHDRSECEKPLLPAQAHKLNLKSSPAKVDGPTIGGALIILTLGLVLTLVIAIVERHLATSKVSVGLQGVRGLDDHLLHTSDSRGTSDVPLA